ncbi:MAG: hypothetical protein IGR92_17595 [Leptolyngbyaceae cyanobacterium T60_A2020_046]|nr:hypothetical protein [Leptolyngbyaceae cyanobacterium T60_A2020_046]
MVVKSPNPVWVAQRQMGRAGGGAITNRQWAGSRVLSPLRMFKLGRSLAYAGLASKIACNCPRSLASA